MAKIEKVASAPVEKTETKENATKTSKTQLSELQQSVYTADELAAMHVKFGTTADIVKTALKREKKDRFTFAEAEKIVKKFLS